MKQITLPIDNKKDEIINAIKNNDTVIITAETGSGKSTKVPQYLYEIGYNVIVTEPRRIAAISLAEFVSESMVNSGVLTADQANNGVVCYHTAFESNYTENSKVIFCTDGLQMAKGINEKTADNTVLVLDEVHEWNLNIETLIAWIKNFRANGNKIKIIIMSATIDTTELQNYFDGAVTITADGKHFPVEWHTFGNEWEVVINEIKKNKNILVFLPGKQEINKFISDLDENLIYENLKAKVLPLHSEMNSSEQKSVFYHYDIPKVIVATNIAQTSITIDDIDTVIDFGTEKRIECENGIEGLFIHNISQADCTQRAGRAGRTKPGDYYLCNADIKFDKREEYSTPEIKRLTLDKVVLKLASVGIDAEELEFFHDPHRKAIIDSKNYLRQIGAIKDQNTITSTGRKIIKLPLSVRYSKMIVEAEKFGVVNDIIVMTAIMEIGSLVNFKKKIQGVFEERNLAYEDFICEDNTMFAEYALYKKICNKEYPDFNKVGINGKNFFKIKDMVKKLTSSIENIIDINAECSDDRYTSSSDRIKRAIASALPNYIFKGGLNTYYDINGFEYTLSKNSPTCSQFVIGIPKVISFKNRYNWDDTINLITMDIDVSRSMVKDIIEDNTPEELREEVDKYSAEWDDSKECFIGIANIYYHDWNLGSKTIEIREGELYDSLMSKRDTEITKERNRFVNILGSIREVYGYHEKYISLNSKELFALDEDELKTRDGSPLYICVRDLRGKNIPKLKQKIIQQEMTKEDENKVNLEGRQLTTVDEIIEIFDNLGEVEINLSRINYKDSYYLGLGIDNNTVKIMRYGSFDDWKAFTTQTLKDAFIMFARKDYTNKFIITRAGTKTRYKEACDEFFAFVSDVANELTIDSFKEDYDFLSECYKDIMTSYGVYDVA